MFYVKCIDCRTEFSELELTNAKCCPACGSVGIPFDSAGMVKIDISW